LTVTIGTCLVFTCQNCGHEHARPVAWVIDRDMTNCDHCALLTDIDIGAQARAILDFQKTGDRPKREAQVAPESPMKVLVD